MNEVGKTDNQQGNDVNHVLAVVTNGDKIQLNIPIREFNFHGGEKVKLFKLSCEVVQIMEMESIVRFTNPLNGISNLQNIPNWQLFNNR